MANYVTVTSDKDKGVAFWLCLFGGMFGLHRFYVGKIGTGLLYLCTGGGFIIGWIADLIEIACGGFKDNSGAPLRAKGNKETPVANNVSSADELTKYKKLLDEGAISQEEYDAMKNKLLK